MSIEINNIKQFIDYSQDLLFIMTIYKDLSGRFILEENFNFIFKNHFENSELRKTLISGESHIYLLINCFLKNSGFA